MTDDIYILNGSRRWSSKIVKECISELNNIRPIEYHELKSDKFIQYLVEETFNTKRNQVNYDMLLMNINGIKEAIKLSNQDKFILIDPDLYSGDTSWIFGGYSDMPNRIGDILISTSRLEDRILAKHVMFHEFGHMFNAPSYGRTNTKEELGLHCTNDLCVMQQKLSVLEAKRYAHERKKQRLFLFVCNVLKI